MQSRRDQVQAHMFVMGRLTSGVLRLEPDGLDQPVTRTSRGVAGGLLIAVLIAVGVALYGFIVPGGSTSWQKAGTLIVVKDSGARYLSLDGVLHPVLNLTSAKLVAGDQMTVTSVKARSLEEAPRGAPFGLVGAPDALPTAEGLEAGPWTACSTRSRDDTGAVSVRLDLSVSLPPAGRTLSRQEAVAVNGPDDRAYLLWNGERLRMDSSDAVLQAIGQAGTDLPKVTASFLDAVPAGPDLKVPRIADAGKAGPTLGGQPTRLGQLFSDGTGNRYVLSGSGLVPITPMLYSLLVSDPTTQSKAYDGEQISMRTLGPDDTAGHLAPTAARDALTSAGALPVTVPRIVQVSLQEAICEQITPGKQGYSTSLLIAGAGGIVGSAPDAETGIQPSCLSADSIAVKPGGGALVNATLSGGGAGAAYFLVTDGGVKYPIPTDAVLAGLGFGAAPATVLPSAWLNLLPTGPTLAPSAVSFNGTGPQAPTVPGCSGSTTGGPGRSGGPGGPGSPAGAGGSAVQPAVAQELPG